MSTSPTPINQSPIPPLDERGLPVGYPFKPDWEVTPRQTKELLARPESDPLRPLLIDCRRADEWALCRIDGAVHIPMDLIMARMDELEEGPQGRNTPIVVQCRSGQRSITVTANLRGVGFTNVKSMAGGILAWSMGIDPSIPRY